jgi:hypothetical protein
MALSMPGSMPISLSAGGGTSGSSSNAGVSTPISNPFNFDDSGWIINFGDGNSSSATGNKDANLTSQTPAASLGGIGGLLGGISPTMLLLAAAAYLLLKR